MGGSIYLYLIKNVIKAENSKTNVLVNTKFSATNKLSQVLNKILH